MTANTPGDPTIEIFCDGSVTNSLLTGVYESSCGDEYLGRAVVIVPAADLGLIMQRSDGMVTEHGTPASEQAEILAIELALDLSRRYALSNSIVYSDCQGAIRRFRDQRVEWRTREQMRLPNDFFDKILGRASYLRRTEGRVKRRHPPQDHQREIFELFNAARCEFRLSESPLWKRVCRDALKYEAALGTVNRG